MIRRIVLHARRSRALLLGGLALAVTSCSDPGAVVTDRPGTSEPTGDGASSPSPFVSWAILESCREREVERDRRQPGADGTAERRALECAARRLRIPPALALERHRRARALDALDSPLCRIPEAPFHQNPVALAPEPLVPLRSLLPPEAREIPIRGVVILRLVISNAGEVADVQVVRPLGVEPTRRAIAAVRDSAWYPALVCGHPAAVHFVVSIPFGAG